MKKRQWTLGIKVLTCKVNWRWSCSFRKSGSGGSCFAFGYKTMPFNLITKAAKLVKWKTQDHVTKIEWHAQPIYQSFILRITLPIQSSSQCCCFLFFFQNCSSLKRLFCSMCFSPILKSIEISHSISLLKAKQIEKKGIQYFTM